MTEIFSASVVPIIRDSVGMLSDPHRKTSDEVFEPQNFSAIRKEAKERYLKSDVQ